MVGRPHPHHVGERRVKPSQYAAIGDPLALQGPLVLTVEVGCGHAPEIRFLVNSAGEESSSFVDVPFSQARAFLVETLRRLDEGFGSWKNQ